MSDDPEFNMWAKAFDTVQDVAAQPGLTVDQRLKVAEIQALLAIGNELIPIAEAARTR